MRLFGEMSSWDDSVRKNHFREVTKMVCVKNRPQNNAAECQFMSMEEQGSILVDNMCNHLLRNTLFPKLINNTRLFLLTSFLTTLLLRVG